MYGGVGVGSHVTGSHDPVGGDPVLAGGEDSDGRQQLLVRHIYVLVDDGGVEIVSIELLYLAGLLSTFHVILIL